MNPQSPYLLHPIIEQITNNTTGWIGHHPRDNNDIARGQTFIASSEADVEAIEVFTNIVNQPGNVKMTIHSFDTHQNSWGPTLGTSNVDFKMTDSGKWITFNIPSLHLDKGKSYGFRLQSHDSFIGVGEAAGSAKHPPFNSGQEWQFTGTNKTGEAFTYFSLAFKVEARA